jgi:hypothetical protein
LLISFCHITQQVSDIWDNGIACCCYAGNLFLAVVCFPPYEIISGMVEGTATILALIYFALQSKTCHNILTVLSAGTGSKLCDKKSTSPIFFYNKLLRIFVFLSYALFIYIVIIFLLMKIRSYVSMEIPIN